MNTSYNAYPVVEVIKSDSSSSCILFWNKVISIFGIPNVIKTEYGPPFNSRAFKQETEHTGFEHRRVTLLGRLAIAKAESFNKPLTKTFKTAHVGGKSWKQELFQFIRQYGPTPHTNTGYPPFQLLLNCELATNLQTVTKGDKLVTGNFFQIQKCGLKLKNKLRTYATNTTNH
ncbi:unnamed protein product [Mytilus coruscus]|uniref:Integrase catalytic domain-containing protein n=1 Tax=Mytilus coruscus TaxID=42192 RepID=A0A6J8D7G7_MYTCO|nr:unnamed protein product [Mytilus coruscus]